MNILATGIFDKIASSPTLGYEWQYYSLLSFALIAVTAASYLLGSINSAVLISRLMYKDDIRHHGSGNAGLTNMLRTYGRGAAALTLLGDMLKTAMALLFAALIFGFRYERGVSLCGFCYLAALCAVVGHVYPIFYGFKGGKGVLVTAVSAVILCPIVFCALFVLFVIIVSASGFVSLGSSTAASLFPVCVCFYSFFIGGELPPLTAVCTLFLGACVVWCH